jgi:hypothetical protein
MVYQVCDIKENSVDSVIPQRVNEYLKHYSIIRHRGVQDQYGRWFPFPEEVASCCKAIHKPTAPYRYTLLKHCLTIWHFANLHELDYTVLRKAIVTSPDYQKLQRHIQAKKALNKIMGKSVPNPDYFGKNKKAAKKEEANV